MSIKSYIWLLPFVFFVCGYFVAHHLFHTETFPTPSVVGKPLSQGVALLSEKGLSSRIIAHKQSTDLPEGVIISQSPAAEQAIKTNQTVSLVLSALPQPQQTPNFLGLTYTACETAAKECSVTISSVLLPSMHPAGTCFAQKPSPGQPTTNNPITLYCSMGEQKHIVWPSFINKSLGEVIAFLAQKELVPQIVSISDNETTNYTLETHVIDQYPRAGALITLSPQKQLPVILHIP